MTNPIVIIADLAKGWAFLSDLYQIRTQQLIDGCVNCSTDFKDRFQRVLLALHYRTGLNVFDEYTEDLYQEMMRLFGESSSTPPVPVPKQKIYFGYKSSNIPLTIEQIEASSFREVSVNGPYTINFGTQAQPLFPWFAEPLSQPVKKEWIDTVVSFNRGNIGTADDLFNAPIVIGNVRFYVSNYETIFENPIQFK